MNVARIKSYCAAGSAVVALTVVTAGCGSSTTPTARVSAAPSGSPSLTTPTSGASTAPSGYPFTFQHLGQTITLAKAPTRVVVESSYPAFLVAQAGGNLTHKVVAIANAGDSAYVPDSADLAGIPFVSPNAPLSKEAVIAYQPQIVIGHSLASPSQAQLASLGINSIVINVCDPAYYPAHHGGTTGFDANYDDILLIGKLLGTEAYAERSVAEEEATVAKAQAAAKHLPASTRALSVASGSIAGGQFVYMEGSESMGNTILQSLGIHNAFGDVPRAPTVSAEEMIARNPGVLVIGYDPSFGETASSVMNQLLAVPGIKELAAVRDHRVFIINDVYQLAGASEGTQIIESDLAGFK